MAGSTHRGAIRVRDVEVAFSDERARAPLKFGAVVMAEVTFCRVRVEVENRAGAVADGWGGIFLADFWSFPTPKLDHATRDGAMRRVVERYARAMRGLRDYGHPIDLALSLDDELGRILRDVTAELSLPVPLNRLTGLVCASPFDAALHDAFGNVNGIDTYDGYGPEWIDHDLGPYLGPAFRGRYPGDYVKPAYDPTVPIFHLVGGLDKLTRRELDAGDPKDAWPVSLDDWIEREGLFCLKVKLVGNDLAWDLDRIARVTAVADEVLRRQGRSELYLSLDTNEQCGAPEYMVELLERLRAEHPRAYAATLYVEQPTERDLAAHRHDMRRLASLKPVLIDESLTDLPAFDLAMELGWSGIALKTCKGQSHSLLFLAKATDAGIPYSVQDLTNPSLALIHSVGFAARIRTIKGVEANSRQFFPESSRAERAAHPDLFDVRDGVVSTTSLRGTGLGYDIARIARERERLAGGPARAR